MRDNPTANSRDRCSHKYMSLIVVRIDLPLHTDPVSPSPSRLTNLKYCLNILPYFVVCDNN